MITLTGTLRQSSQVTFKDKPPRLKLVIEHETARQTGDPDIHLETLFVDPTDVDLLPVTGSQVSIEVRPYPKGRDVAYSATRVVPPASADPVAVA